MGQALEVMRQWFQHPTPDMLAEDTEWYVPGYPVPQSTYRGAQSVFCEFFPALTSQFAEWGAKTEYLIEASDGERVTVVGRYEGMTHTGEPVKVPFIHVWTVQDKLITHVISSADTARFMAALPR